MKFSIKYRFSLFLTSLLLLLMGVVSYLLLYNIEKYQIEEQERILSSQKLKSETYIYELFFILMGDESQQEFLNDNGENICASISAISDMKVRLYNANREKIGSTIDNKDNIINLSRLFNTVDKNNDAYFTKGNFIYCMSLLTRNDKFLGYIVYKYSIKKDILFYKRIKSSLIQIGIGGFTISLIISILYFNRYIRIIIALKNQVKDITNEKYKKMVLKRKDELGELENGITKMGIQIKRNIEKIKKDKHNLGLAVEKLKLLGNQQKQFIGDFTHEFKTPLS